MADENTKMTKVQHAIGAATLAVSSLGAGTANAAVVEVDCPPLPPAPVHIKKPVHKTPSPKPAEPAASAPHAPSTLHAILGSRPRPRHVIIPTQTVDKCYDDRPAEPQNFTPVPKEVFDVIPPVEALKPAEKPDEKCPEGLTAVPKHNEDGSLKTDDKGKPVVECLPEGITFAGGGAGAPYPIYGGGGFVPEQPIVLVPVGGGMELPPIVPGIPEPSTGALLGAGLAAAEIARRVKNSKAKETGSAAL